MSDDTKLALLQAALGAAVPLHVDELARMPLERVRTRGRRLAKFIAEKGDVILYRSKKRGETALAFNALAGAVAALSFSPGGVTFLGLHFESRHPDQLKERT